MGGFAKRHDNIETIYRKLQERRDTADVTELLKALHRIVNEAKALLASLRTLLQPIQDWAQKAATEAEVKIFILGTLYRSLPRPPYTEGDTEEIAARVYEYVWGRSVGGAAIAA